MSFKHESASADNSFQPIAYSISTAVAVSGLGRSAIYSMIKDGRLPIRKAGRRTIILHSDLEALLRSLPTGEAA